MLLQSMDAVSFSKERDLRAASQATRAPVSFEPTLGKTGALVRDIVSDADKLVYGDGGQNSPVDWWDSGSSALPVCFIGDSTIRTIVIL